MSVKVRFLKPNSTYRGSFDVGDETVLDNDRRAQIWVEAGVVEVIQGRIQYEKPGSESSPPEDLAAAAAGASSDDDDDDGGAGEGERPKTLSRMNKGELIAYAAEHDIEIDPDGTVATILDKIREAEAGA